MDFPTEFLTLAFNTLGMLGKETEWDEPLVQNAREGLDGPRRQTRLGFLNTILDGRYDDKQTEKLWFSAGSEAAFFNPGGTRPYLSVIQELLTRENPR